MKERWNMLKRLGKPILFRASRSRNEMYNALVVEEFNPIFQLFRHLSFRSPSHE